LRHSHPLTPEALAQWAQALEERRAWLARRGIHYLVMFPPNKHTIYPELVRGTYDQVRSQSRYDQLARYLREHTSVDVLDLREPLLKAKAQGRLFYRRDTHWNHTGAFVAYQVIVNALTRWYPDLRPWPRSALRGVPKFEPNPDLSLMLGLSKEFPEWDFSLEPKFARRAHPAHPGPGLTPNLIPDKSPVAMECDDATLPRAVIFRDSFSIALIPLLSEHFARSLYLWHCPFDPAIIERECPDLVIEEYVERRLWQPPPASGLPESWIARKTGDAVRQ
jgi:hypothetical protein